VRRSIALGVGALVVILMAWDHLIGNRGDGDAFPVDPATFLLAIGLAVVTAGVVWLVVRRADATAKDPVAPALALAVAGIVTAVMVSWLAIPQVLAGGALMLGLDLLGAGRRGVGYAVIATATLTLLLGVLATAIPPVDND
jgi:hypothetical protein